MKLPIVPVGISISNKIIIGSWDRFKFPIPFSRCVIYWGSPIWVKEVSEFLREKLEAILIEVNACADALL